MFGNTDGSLKFATEIDSKGFEGVMGKLASIAKGGMGAVAGAIGAVTAGLGAMAVSAMKVGSDFEAGMSQVAATMGITASEIAKGDESFEKLKAAAKEMGESTKFSATQASEALNYLALAGFDANKSIELLPKTLALAAAGGMDLAPATDMITDSMSALGISVNEADGFIDEMARTSQKSNTSVSQLGDAILTVGASAKTLKGGTNELNTALGLLANVGFKGAEGGTKLRNIIMAMTPTTKQAKEAFEQLGVSTYDAEGNLRSLSDIFKDMDKAMVSMSQEEKTRIMSSIFNKQDLAAANGLMAQCTTSLGALSAALSEMGQSVPEEQLRKWYDTLDEFKDKEDFVSQAMEQFGLSAEAAGLAYDTLAGALEDGSAWDTLSENINNSKGAAEEMAKVMADNLKGDITIFQSALEGLGITIYESFGVNMREAVQMLTDMVGELNTAAKEGIEPFAKKIGEVFSELVSEIANKAPEVIDAAVEIIGAFLEGITNNSEKISEGATSIITSLVEGILKLTPKLLEAAAKLLFEFAKALIKEAPTLVETAGKLLTDFVKGLIDNLPEIIDCAAELVVTLANGITDCSEKATDAAIELFNAIIDGLLENLPEIVEAAIKLVLALAGALIENVPKLLQAGEKLLIAVVDGVLKAIPKMINAGKEIIKGLWQGIKEKLSWLKDKVAEVPRAITGKIKGALGIKSPSTVFRDEIGKNLALGLGLGFEDGFEGVSERMKASVLSFSGEFANLGASFEARRTIEHKGIIRVEGANNRGELIDVVKIMKEEMRREARLC